MLAFYLHLTTLLGGSLKTGEHQFSVLQPGGPFGASTCCLWQDKSSVSCCMVPPHCQWHALACSCIGLLLHVLHCALHVAWVGCLLKLCCTRPWRAVMTQVQTVDRDI